MEENTIPPSGGGIYQIRNLISGKIYIGSSAHFHKRWMSHKSDLKMGLHRTRGLQADWDRMGAEAFIFEVLVHSPDMTGLKIQEQDILDSITADIYNERKAVRTRRLTNVKRSELNQQLTQRAMKKFKTLVSPEGDEFLVANVKEFAEKHDLSLATLHLVATGKQHSHQGWTSPAWGDKPIPVSTRKTFVVIAPDGTHEETNNLAQFCRDHDLPYSIMINVSDGATRYCQGWRCYPKGKPPKWSPDPKVEFAVISPDGMRHEIFTLRSFAAQNNLSYPRLQGALERGGMTADGWRCYRIDDPDQWIPAKAIEVVGFGEEGRAIFNLKAFARSVGIPHMTFYSVLRGRRPPRPNWSIRYIEVPIRGTIRQHPPHAHANQ